MADLLLAVEEKSVHGSPDERGLLDAVEALAGIAQPVGADRAEEVLLAQVPQLEHVVGDLSPQGERLERVVVLPLVVVRQARALLAVADGQRVALLDVGGAEVLLEQSDHLVDLQTQKRHQHRVSCVCRVLCVWKARTGSLLKVRYELLSPIE